MFWLAVVLRWMHILGALTLVGSALFYWKVLMPANVAEPTDQPTSAWNAVRGRWARLVILSILLLLVSGMANVVIMGGAGEFKQVPMHYHILLLLKIILAVVVFLLMSLITGKRSAAKRLQSNMQLWISLTVLLAVLVVMLAGVMKLTPRNSSEETGARDRSHLGARGTEFVSIQGSGPHDSG